MTFSDLGLPAELLRAIADAGYETPTPVQRDAIPAVLSGRDLIAGAQTGTGKTAAFTLPTLALLAERGHDNKRGRAPRVLVLTPTRELAAQVSDSVKAYGAHLPFRCTTVFGGVGINPQKDALRRGTDILVATPGRLLDLIAQGDAKLSAIEILVLDEADRMLDMGFIRDIRKVLGYLPKERQNLLFSATYSEDIRALADSLLVDPVGVEVARRNTAAETVGQCVYAVEKDEKRAALTKLIEDGNWFQVLVFTRTKHGADRLARQLDKAGIGAAAIHGNKSQNARTRALAAFKQGELRVLVATDIAARGLDIDKLPHVVNFELPNVPEDYVHRIGRTGRAGAEGQAVSLVSPDEGKLLRDIERLLGREVIRAELDGFAAAKLTGAGKPAPKQSQRASQGPKRERGPQRARRNDRAEEPREVRGAPGPSADAPKARDGEGTRRRRKPQRAGQGEAGERSQGRGQGRAKGQSHGQGQRRAQGEGDAQRRGRNGAQAEGRGQRQERGPKRGPEGRGPRAQEGRGNGRRDERAQGNGNGNSAPRGKLVRDENGDVNGNSVDYKPIRRGNDEARSNHRGRSGGGQSQGHRANRARSIGVLGQATDGLHAQERHAQLAEGRARANAEGNSRRRG